MYPILDRINSPADIKSLGIDELKQLCNELRQYIIEVCSTNPGHLGSSLGAVELRVGWHYVFDAPEDKIVFDVGHQALMDQPSFDYQELQDAHTAWKGKFDEIYRRKEP